LPLRTAATITAMTGLDPITLRLDEDTFRRIEVVAEKKNKDPLALVNEFIIERLYEEEKREGMLGPPDAIPYTPSAEAGNYSHDRRPSTGWVEVYTDGGCEGNPGRGGWAAVIYDGPSPEEIYGYEPKTTNNRMELRAAIEGLRHLEEPSRVRIYSDSEYLINPVKKGWLAKWEKNGWRKADKKPVQNTDLWRELLEAMSPHEVEWIKVRGHAGIGANERCHSLVQLAIRRGFRESPRRP
jgi:ribonuclease HI